jgi:predicted Zn-dependent protease
LRPGKAWCAAAVAAVGALTPGLASAQGLPLIRDTEIENLLNDYARPIFKAANLGSGRVAVRIVNNENFNAFVVDGRNVFIHTGALMQAQTPNEVIGVLAHEAGHIAGGQFSVLVSWWRAASQGEIAAGTWAARVRAFSLAATNSSCAG